jgi:hypothetical protein
LTVVAAASRFPRIGACVLVLALVLAIGGCGSDSESSGSEEEQVMEMFNAWQISFAEGDGDATCSKLTESARDEVMRYGKMYGYGDGDGDGSCEDVVHQSVEATDKAGIEQQPSKAISARIRGNKAVIRVVDDGRPPVRGNVVKEDGEWKLPTAGFSSFLGEKTAKP